MSKTLYLCAILICFIALVGCGATQPELVPGYVRRLNQEQVMQGHAFSQLEMQRPASSPGAKQHSQSKYIEFRLSTQPGVAVGGSRGGQ